MTIRNMIEKCAAIHACPRTFNPQTPHEIGAVRQFADFGVALFLGIGIKPDEECSVVEKRNAIRKKKGEK